MKMMLIFPSHSGNQNILCDLITLYCAGGCNEKKVESLKNGAMLTCATWEFALLYTEIMPYSNFD